MTILLWSLCDKPSCDVNSRCYKWWWCVTIFYHYHLQTNLRVGNVFTDIYLFTGGCTQPYSTTPPPVQCPFCPDACWETHTLPRRMAEYTPVTATAAGGMDPTGMHTCFLYYFWLKFGTFSFESCDHVTPIISVSLMPFQCIKHWTKWQQETASKDSYTNTTWLSSY